ncbi:MAG: ATP-binding protein [Methanobacterium sp.]
MQDIAKFREIFKKSPIGILFFDKKGNLTDANPSALELGGVSSLNDITGLNLFSEVNIGFKDELFEKGTVKLEYPVNFDDVKKLGIYNSKRSGIAFIDLTISVINSGFLVQIQDITERKKTENKLKNARDTLEGQVKERTMKLEDDYKSLKETEKRSRSLLMASSEVLYRMSPDWKEMRQLQSHDFLANTEKPNRNWLKEYIHPDDQEYVIAAINEAIKTKSIFELAHRVFQADGSLGWTFSRAIPIFDTNGEIIEWFGAASDITPKKNAEEKVNAERHRFNDVMDILPAYLILLTQDYHVAFANRFFRERFGEDCGKRCYEYLFGLTEPCENCETYKVLKTGKSHHWEWAGPDGRYYDIYDFPFKDFDGSLLIMEFGIDITERKKMESEREELITELERSNEELQSFAYITSHDLQEPLRTIASYAQLFKRRYHGQLDSDAAEFIDYMVSGSKRMKQQILGLLEYSRVGTRDGDFWKFSSEKAFRDALSNLNSSIEECNAEITYDSLPDITGDESQIIRVFQNLIGNALKFRKEDVQPKVHISAQKEENEYIFSVSDNGIGIEEQYTDRIFEVFKRLHAIGEFEGAGIGLAIVKRIINRHGGHVWIKSQYKKGSTFYFTIPIDSAKTQ